MSCSSSEDNLRWNRDTIVTKMGRSISFCSMGWTSFLSRQRAARKNPPRPLSGTSLSVTPNMPSAFRREGTARMEPLPIFRCTWSERQKSFYDFIFEERAYNASQSSFTCALRIYTMKSSCNFSSRFSIHTPLFPEQFQHIRRDV